MTFAGEQLRGELKGRMVKVWAPIEHTGDYVYSLQAEVRHGNVSGTFTARFTPRAQGAIPALQEQREKRQGSRSFVKGVDNALAQIQGDTAKP